MAGAAEVTAVAEEDTLTGTTAVDMATALNLATMIVAPTPLMGKHENQAPMRAYV